MSGPVRAPSRVPAHRRAARAHRSRAWRAVARTTIQAALGGAAAAPELAHATGLPEAAPWVVTGLAVCAAVTRVMNTAAVEGWLARRAPWLAAGHGEATEAARDVAAAVITVRQATPTSVS